VKEPSIDDLVQLPEAVALQRHFDARNLSRLRWLLSLVTLMALVGLAVAVAGAARVSALRVGFYVANVVAVLGFIAVYRERFFERYFRQILVAYFFVHMALPTLWNLSSADFSLQMGGLFPLILMAFRLRLLEYLLLYGTFWVSDVLVHTGAVAGAVVVGGGVAAGPAPVVADSGVAIGISAALAACLVGAIAWAQVDRRRFVAVWRREHSRSRERLRMREEIEYARKIQLSMLPQAPPDIPWLDLSAASLPATEVGGDYYDIFRLAPGRLALVIADVSGHGLASGLLLSGVRSCLYLLDADLAAADAVGRLDRMVRRTTDRRTYVTLLLALVDEDAKTLAVTAAGHPPLLHFHVATGAVDEVGSGAPPLGTFADSSFVRCETAIAAGDLLVVYTDGVTEMRNDHGEDYGGERLRRAIARAAPGRTAREVRDSVLSELANFKGSAEQADDITLVVARLR
jgi:serine phosphatase RsbU (regulator of sigma subunit)